MTRYLPTARLIATIILSAALAGCLPEYRNDARPGRLGASEVDFGRSTIVYGIDASNGPLSVSMRWLDQADGGLCGLAAARTPDASTGTTFFVFDVPAGTYSIYFPEPGGRLKGYEYPTFVAPPGRQVYIGRFSVGSVDEWEPPFEFAPGQQWIALDRALEPARATLGPAAASLALVEVGETRALPFGYCSWFPTPGLPASPHR